MLETVIEQEAHPLRVPRDLESRDIALAPDSQPKAAFVPAHKCRFVPESAGRRRNPSAGRQNDGRLSFSAIASAQKSRNSTHS